MSFVGISFSAMAESSAGGFTFDFELDRRFLVCISQVVVWMVFYISGICLEHVLTCGFRSCYSFGIESI